MRIRLHNTPEENDALVTLLTALFEVVGDSGNRPPRGGGGLHYRYLDVRTRTGETTVTVTAEPARRRAAASVRRALPPGGRHT